METITKVQSKTITNTKLVVATLLALGAGAIAFIVTPYYTKGVGPVYDSYCIVAGKNVTLPKASAPDYGSNYVKTSIGNRKGLPAASKHCTTQIYNNLIKAYCSSASTTPVKNLKLSVAGFANSTSTNGIGENLAYYGCAKPTCWKLNACNTIVSTTVGSLTVIKDSSFVNGQISPGTYNTKIGQYSLYASNIEDISISNIEIGVNNPSIIDGLFVMELGSNHTFGNTITKVGFFNKFINNPYQLPLTIKKGKMITIGLFANIKSSAIGNLKTYIKKSSVNAVGQSSKIALSQPLPTTNVEGQTMTINTSTAVKQYYLACMNRSIYSSSTPAYQPHEEITPEYYKLNFNNMTVGESIAPGYCFNSAKVLYNGYCTKVNSTSTKPYKMFMLLYDSASSTQPVKTEEFEPAFPAYYCSTP